MTFAPDSLLTMTDFICAYFGKDWTISARGFASAKQAEKHGLYMMPMAGCFGFAVIAEDANGWQLKPNNSILSPRDEVTRDDLNNYKIVSC